MILRDNMHYFNTYIKYQEPEFDDGISYVKRNNHGLLIGLKYWDLTQEYKELGDYGDRMVNNAFGIFLSMYIEKEKSIKLFQQQISEVSKQQP